MQSRASSSPSNPVHPQEIKNDLYETDSANIANSGSLINPTVWRPFASFVRIILPEFSDEILKCFIR